MCVYICLALHMCVRGCMNFSTCVYVTAFVCACSCICVCNHMCIAHAHMCKRHFLFCVKCRGHKGVLLVSRVHLMHPSTYQMYPTVPQMSSDYWAPSGPPCISDPLHSWAFPLILPLALDTVSSACDLLESAFSSKSRLSAVSPMEPFLISRHRPVDLPVSLTHSALYHRLRLCWSVLCYEYKFCLLSLESSPSRGPMRIFH